MLQSKIYKSIRLVDIHFENVIYIYNYKMWISISIYIYGLFHNPSWKLTSLYLG